MGEYVQTGQATEAGRDRTKLTSALCSHGGSRPMMDAKEVSPDKEISTSVMNVVVVLLGDSHLKTAPSNPPGLRYPSANWSSYNCSWSSNEFSAQVPREIGIYIMPCLYIQQLLPGPPRSGLRVLYVLDSPPRLLVCCMGTVALPLCHTLAHHLASGLTHNPFPDNAYLTTQASGLH